MKELIEKLRKVGTLCGDYHQFSTAKTITQEAADAIEKLQAELEHTRKEKDALAKELFNLAVTAETKCDYCKHNCTITCGVCSNGSKWEWRGTKEA